MTSTVDHHEVKQLPAEVEHRAYRDIRDLLGILDSLGRGHQINAGRMLRESGLELDRIEPFAVLTQRRNRLLRIEMEQHAQSAVLQVQVDHGHAFFEAAMQRRRDNSAQRTYPNAPNQALHRMNR